MDTLTKLQRSIRMSKIKSKDTTPELKVRRCLFEKNIRYRINNKNLPGKPDVSIMKYRLIIDVRGCFWHAHDKCVDGHIPKSNSSFWREKFKKNKERDKKNLKKLLDMDFKVFVIWECETRQLSELNRKINEITDYINEFKKINIH